MNVQAADAQPTKSSRRAGAAANRVLPEDRPAHEWYRFVLSFPPHIVRQYVDRFGLTCRSRLLDPFCGTGTTVVECKKLGIAGVGIEAHPMAAFASGVKTNWRGSPDHLLEHAARIAAETSRTLACQGLTSKGLPLGRRGAVARVPLLSLPPDAAALLLKDSISPLPLHKALTLLRVMERHGPDPAAPYERLALARALVASIGNLHFGPEVGISPPKPDAPVVSDWLAAVRIIAADLQVLQGLASRRAKIIRADSRSGIESLDDESVDAVITSPPYPNEKDYTRTTRLESVILGFINTKDELRALKKTFVRSNTRGVYREDDDDQWVAANSRVQEIAAAIERRRLELGKTSGFERMYHRVTKLYFGGMARHLASLQRVLKPGARLAYVVGDQASYLRVMIRTGELLAEIAASRGYQVESIDLFRTRAATATRAQLREEVLVLRWPGRPAATSSRRRSSSHRVIASNEIVDLQHGRRMLRARPRSRRA